MEAVSSIILAKGYSQNSPHVCRDLTIAVDQSELWTLPCYVRIKVLKTFVVNNI